MTKQTWKYRVRPMRIIFGIAFIPISTGEIAMIDASDAHLIAGFNLSAKPASGGLIYCQVKKRTLHQLIIEAPEGFFIDHINRNGLDCRRKNLRIATDQESARNRGKKCDGVSRYKGVGASNGKWRARIALDHGRKHIGYFKTEADAAMAYDREARLHFGRFAVVNFG